VWDNLRFNSTGIEDMQRSFFGTLYNTYNFFALYANIDNFSYVEADIPMWKRPEIDRWILSTLHSLVNEVDADYAAYEATNATRKVMYFVDEHLSNWYVRLCRRRFWKGEYTDDKIAAYQTLYECLNTLAKLMAPVAPFFADWLYRNLNGETRREPHQSVHLALIEAADGSLIDKALEQRMEYAQRISSLVLSLRKKEKLRVRQPLERVLLPVLDESFIAQVDGVKTLSFRK
jgi:isoleucyl-tRNA synthetase